jgi:uncharacterized sodium:solute symporter family permease YidK
MQFLILLLGVMVFVFYLFAPPPAFFNPVERAKLLRGPVAAEATALEARHLEAWQTRRAGAERLTAAIRSKDGPRRAVAAADVKSAESELAAIRSDYTALMRRADPQAQTNDTNYVFLSFVLAYLPAGLIGLVFAAVFAASMNSTSAELSALTSTTVVDVIRRLPGHRADERREVATSRVVTLFWAAFAIAFAQWASGLGTLVEAVNILGSLFYGTILGIFLTAFYLKRVSGSAVFIAALIAEAIVIACFALTKISFLWYNLIGAVLVMAIALALNAVLRARREPANA